MKCVLLYRTGGRATDGAEEQEERREDKGGRTSPGHVTKPAVNNVDGQCCELRWYQSHKWHGFMLAAQRRDQPHRAIIRFFVVRVMSVREQPRCHANRRSPLIVESLLSLLSVFSFRGEANVTLAEIYRSLIVPYDLATLWSRGFLFSVRVLW